MRRPPAQRPRSWLPRYKASVDASGTRGAVQGPRTQVAPLARGAHPPVSPLQRLRCCSAARPCWRLCALRPAAGRARARCTAPAPQRTSRCAARRVHRPAALGTDALPRRRASARRSTSARGAACPMTRRSTRCVRRLRVARRPALVARACCAHSRPAEHRPRRAWQLLRVSLRAASATRAHRGRV